MNTRSISILPLLLGFWSGALLAEAEPLRIHFISGSNEYRSEPSLKAFKDHLEKKFKVVVTAPRVKDSAKEFRKEER